MLRKERQSTGAVTCTGTRICASHAHSSAVFVHAKKNLPEFRDTGISEKPLSTRNTAKLNKFLASAIPLHSIADRQLQSAERQPRAPKGGHRRWENMVKLRDKHDFSAGPLSE